VDPLTAVTRSLGSRAEKIRARVKCEPLRDQTRI